jgi:hypothetical protein
MASPFTVAPVQGVDLNTITTAADIASGSFGSEDAPQLGTQVFGSDGRRYVYAQANATITASTAVCTVNATTFLATATGGSYRSPAVAMATGDRGWFSVASV